MQPFILWGDSTDHGGKVVTASPTFTINGRGVARVGDSVSCPKHGHTNVVIATGDPTSFDDGKPIAYNGCKTSCGATLLSSQASSFIDLGGGSGGRSNRSSASGNSAGSAVQTDDSFDERFQLLNEETNQPLADHEYAIVRETGAVEHGRTDSQGHTHLLSATKQTENVSVYA